MANQPWSQGEPTTPQTGSSGGNLPPNDGRGRPVGTIDPKSGSLAYWLRREIRRRILDGEFGAGKQLPSEAEFCDEYGVSRSTVRSAMQALATQGLVDICHGSGTYVADWHTGIRASLQELRSMSETIRELGHQSEIQLRRKVVRIATPMEQSKLRLGSDELVVALDRMWLSDGHTVAHSFDAIPLGLIPALLVEELGEGSTFEAFKRFGMAPSRALTELHAASHVPGAHEGAEALGNSLYLLLDQVHYDRMSRSLMYSRSYFVEGAFMFVLMRTT